MSHNQTAYLFFKPPYLLFQLMSNLVSAKLWWSFRRLFVPVTKSALVLEVGSGGNPYPRSNVLLDAFEETRERHWDPLIHDRPTVLSLGENLPFKDKSFDFVIAAHVLEHTPYPEKFLAELQRVACAGYIETPDAFMERINPYKDHRLEVTLRDEGLVIRKKPAWIYDSDIVELYEKHAKPIIASETIPQHPSDFHVRYYWQDSITYRIVNPEVDATWMPPAANIYTLPMRESIKAKLRRTFLSIVRKCFSQSSRNAKLDILPLMRCPKCHSEDLERVSQNDILCNDCYAHFTVTNNIFRVH